MELDRIAALEHKFAKWEALMEGNPTSGYSGLMPTLQEIKNDLSAIKDDHERRIEKMEHGMYGDEMNESEGIVKTVRRVDFTLKRAQWMLAGVTLVANGALALYVNNLAAAINAKP